MRSNLISLILAILIAVFTLGNIVSAQQQPEVVWSQSWGTDYYDVLNRFDYAYPNYVAVGTENSSIDSSSIYITRIGEYGSFSWENTYQFQPVTFGDDVTRCWDDQGFVVSGTSRPSINVTTSTGHLVKFAVNGSVLWAGSYAPGQLQMGTRVIKCWNHDFVLMGNQNTGLGSVLIRVDSSGTQLWQKTITNSYSCAIDLSYGNGFYLAGSRWSYPHQSTDFFLAELTAAGDTVWTKSLGDSGVYEQLVDIRRTLDNNLIAVGKKYFGYGVPDRIFLVKFNLAGNILWSRDIGGYQTYYPFSVSEDQDGGYLIGGFAYGEYENLPLCIKTNSNGYVRWVVDGGINPANCYFNDVKRNQINSGYTAVGMNAPGMYYNKMIAGISADPPTPVSATAFAGYNNLPFTGGQFNFQVVVANNSSFGQTFDVWGSITTPQGSPVPTFTVLNKQLAGRGGLIRNLTQNIPASAPGGTYIYTIYVGDHPWTANWTESFTFTKSGGSGDNGLEDGGWICSGWGEDNVVATATVDMLPTKFCSSASPNPFNPTTTIFFTLPQSGLVNLAVFDINGRRVATLSDGFREAGSHQVNFDGSNLASGIYLYRLEAGNQTATGKMMLMK